MASGTVTSPLPLATPLLLVVTVATFPRKLHAEAQKFHGVSGVWNSFLQVVLDSPCHRRSDNFVNPITGAVVSCAPQKAFPDWMGSFGLFELSACAAIAGISANVNVPAIANSRICRELRNASPIVGGSRVIGVPRAERFRRT
jgi:hypothetical protein